MPINVCHGDAGKEELKVANHAVIVVGLGPANAAVVCTACGEHVTRWAVWGASDRLAFKV
jgi:hypothetical protein